MLHLRSIAALTLLLLVAGCSSNDTNESDASRMEGSWRLEKLVVNGGPTDLMPVLATFGVSEVSGTFTGSTFKLSAVKNGTRTDTEGTFTINESTETMTLNSPGFEEAVAVSYSFDGDDQLTLSATDVALLSELSGIDIASLPLTINRVAFVLERQ